MNQTSSSVLPEKGSLVYFTTVCVVAALGRFLFGYDTAVVSGTNAFVKAQFQLGPLMEGWIVSSALVGCVIGSGAAGWLSDRFGRKTVLVLSAFLFVFTSLGCAFAPGPQLLAMARLIGGLGVGVAGMVAPLYIAEISPPHIRGRMISVYQFAITIGILVAYFANALFQHLHETPLFETSGGLYHWMIVEEVWRGMFVSLLFPAGLFFVLALGVPESPRWLTKQGEEDRALGILARVTGAAEARREMAEIRETIAHEAGDFRQLFRPGIRAALIMAVFLACAAQLSGINAVIYYGPKILETAGFKISNALGGQVILGIVNVLFTVLAMWQVDKMGRRPLLFVGNLGVFCSLVAIGAFFAQGVVGGYWLIAFLCTYLACFAFSLGPLPWVFMAEVFPTRVRGRAMSVAVLCLWAANTVVCQTFPWLSDPANLGPARTCWIYAAMVFPVFLFVWKFMPETKGRSLEELEKYFSHSG